MHVRRYWVNGEYLDRYFVIYDGECEGDGDRWNTNSVVGDRLLQL